MKSRSVRHTCVENTQIEVAMSKKFSSSRLSKAAALGFVLGAATGPQDAHAYYALGLALLGSTTTSIGLGIWGGVVLTKNTGENQAVAVGTTTRRMVDVALLAMHSDLGMQADLLRTSPTAFRQLSSEMEQGGGPAVDALQRATGLPQERLVATWAHTLADTGPVRSEEAAAQMVQNFMRRIGPELTVSTDVAAEFAWQLIREQSDSSLQPSGRTHAWIADWLGVDEAEIAEACVLARQQVALESNSDTRQQLYQEPAPFLDAFATTLEAEHGEQIRKRLDEITRTVADRKESSKKTG
jgi:hypothetical protein